MAVLFSESKTKQNLMRAFAGEGQARNRYTFAAEQARKEGKHAIADIFLYTADQERAHAGRYYELLKEASGTNIFIDGSYPVDETKTLVQLLRAAEHNEQEEAKDVYPAFADVAKQEGFFEAAATFQQIAEIEAAHSQRFRKIADSLENNTFYMCENTDGTKKWICTNCGHIHEGKEAPALCPVCKHPQGYFLPCFLDLHIGFEVMGHFRSF